MTTRIDFLGKSAGLFLALVFLLPSLAVAASISVNCNAGDTIKGALPKLKPGDKLVVSGTCVENVAVGGASAPNGQFDGITLDGQGTATISGPDSSTNTLELWSVRNFTIKGFRITGGRDGIVVNAGQVVGIENNTIEQVGRHGISVQRGTTLAHVKNSVIQNNPGNGIVVNEASYVRIGFGSVVEATEGDTGANTIQGNGGEGVRLQRASMARILLNTIRNNGSNGVLVEKLSYAEIASNIIEGNAQDGVRATQNSGVLLGQDTGTGNENRPNDTGTPNRKCGVEISLGAYVDGRLGSLTGISGAMCGSTEMDYPINSLIP